METASPRRQGRSSKRSRLVLGACGVSLAAVAAGAAVVLLSSGNAPSDVLVTPARLGTFVRTPQLEQQVDVTKLKQGVIAKSNGQVTNVVSAVYENSAGVAGSATPQIMLFIGGNLSGVSPGSFVASFTGRFRGAMEASAGTMGGSAACVNTQSSSASGVALCIWADSGTFGVVASPTMTVTQLDAQMLAIRPNVETPPAK